MVEVNFKWNRGELLITQYRYFCHFIFCVIFQSDDAVLFFLLISSSDRRVKRLSVNVAIKHFITFIWMSEGEGTTNEK